MLADVSRTTVYVKRKPVVFVESDEVLKRLIDEEYTRHPFYGSRKMVVYLGRCVHLVNRKRVQRLMRCMSLAGMAPGPNTSTAHPQHKVYAYLLRGVPVVQSGLEHGHHLRASGARLCLLGGCDRLVFKAGAELANQQQHGAGVLRGLPGGRLARAWQTRGVQQ